MTQIEQLAVLLDNKFNDTEKMIEFMVSVTSITDGDINRLIELLEAELGNPYCNDCDNPLAACTCHKS